VDQVYINAVQLMTGNAGWPLNVITLPDGRPVWGGTYFQKEDWIQAIDQIQELYQKEPEKLESYATRLTDGIKSMDLITLNTNPVDFSQYETNRFIEKWSTSFDTRFGGFRGAPKFMMPNNIALLMRLAVAENNPALLQQLTLTLEQMAFGGVYDHIGGGFSRYSTDEKWHIPHFEKMLYDNAQLVSLYSNAYLISKNPLYKEIVTETLTYVAREMTNNEGAFYSSLDADSENEFGALEEGAYYIYKEEELKEQLGPDFGLFKAYYNVNEFGKWEEENAYVLIRDQSDKAISQEFSISIDTLLKKKKKWKKNLLAYRNLRQKPRLDDKTLTSWNGLMLKGYVDAYKAFQDEAYLDAALKNARFISEKQRREDGALYHNYKDGVSTINGYLEDYSAVIDAFISLYEVTLDPQWIMQAKELADYSFEHFFDNEKSMFYFTSNEDEEIISRNFEYRDNVIPASNSMMAKNLFILSHHFDEKQYATTAQQMLKNVLSEVEQYPSGFSNWIDLLFNYQSQFYEVVIVGTDAQEKTRSIHQQYLPNILVAGSTTEGTAPLLEGRYSKDKTLIYVCVNNTCKLPVTEISLALKLIKPQ
ncbi:MAG: thioredoxin domain-containing protein, partial [Bacteroidetes bacterium]|nr:thioredoxin domain-containing protein [Bacteroidota bacterium]